MKSLLHMFYVINSDIDKVVATHTSEASAIEDMERRNKWNNTRRYIAVHVDKLYTA